MRLGPAQIHAQQHLGPVLRLGASGARLDIDEGVGGIHFPREHAPELQIGDAPLEALQVRGDRVQGIRVVLFGGHLEQIAGIRESGSDLLDGDDDRLQRSTFAAERLRPLRIAPDVGGLQLAQNLGQPFLLVGIVKDTPSGTQCVPGGQR